MKYANLGAIPERTIGVEAPLGRGWLGDERLFVARSGGSEGAGHLTSRSYITPKSRCHR
jgi:hypothetical protein